MLGLARSTRYACRPTSRLSSYIAFTASTPPAKRVRATAQKLSSFGVRMNGKNWECHATRRMTEIRAQPAAPALPH